MRPRRYHLSFMGSLTPPRNGEPLSATIGDHRAWWLLLLALLVWQSWLTLTLFDGDRPWQSVVDERPILSGRHPLHLYHGYLGARTLREHGSLSCYDPTFHAGYPKTPIFDSGSRPAELVLALSGGHYCPAAYKIGMALMCAVVPLLIFTAARGVGLNRAAACLTCLLGLLIWWGQPCRDILETGDIDLLLASLLVVVQAGLLIRYHLDPGPLSWLGVVAASLLGWFAHPLLMAVLMPVFLIYYLSAGHRHRLTWHLALLGGLLTAIGVNSFWLIDWVSYWWIRVSPHRESPLLAEPTVQKIWELPLWGGPVEKGLICVLVLAATAGVVLYNQNGRRATARLLGLSWAGFLAMSLASLMWEPLARFGASSLLVPALLFAVLPAAHALTVAAAVAWRRPAGRWASLFAVAAVAVLLWRAPLAALDSWATRLRGANPLRLGLDADQQAILEALREHTTPEARILWEDRVTPALSSHWTPLLSLWTERAYIGGLDAEASIEHTTNGLAEAVLMGTPIRDWSDDALGEYTKRYNIGWVVCWTPGACERLRGWSQARLLATLPPSSAGESPGCLFAVTRQRYSFALSGSARWLVADPQRIILGDVTGASGGSEQQGKKQILLSLHYQAGMRVAPSRVQLDSYTIERGRAVPGDSRPFVRLWIDEPVTRVTITWDKR
jgi:hypothetical protein